MAFFWEGNTGGVTTPQQAARKRAISEAMLGQSRSGANNWGEGLARVAQALTGTVLEGRAAEAEQAGADEVAALLAGLSPESGFGDISAALANPWIAESPGASAIAQALLGENMRRSDPMYGIGLEKAQLELDRLRNPAAPEPIKVGDVLLDPVTFEPLYDGRTDTGFTLSPGQQRFDALGNPIASVAQSEPDLTNSIQNYEYLIGQGVDPASAQQAAFGGQTINVGGNNDIGSIPQGMMVDRDAAGNVIGMRPIPGGPAEAEALSAQGVENAQISSNVGSAMTTLDTTRAILDLLDNSGGAWTTGTMSRAPALLSDTPAGQIRSHVRTLQSGVALGAMQRLKEASATGATGFGALNAKELDILISEMGALDPDTTDPRIFRETVERIDERAKRVISDIQRNVSPERIAELGLDDLIAAYAPQSQANPEIFGGGQIGNQPMEIAPGITIRRLD